VDNLSVWTPTSGRSDPESAIVTGFECDGLTKLRFLRKRQKFGIACLPGAKTTTADLQSRPLL
jgi:hypothetical protein